MCIIPSERLVLVFFLLLWHFCSHSHEKTSGRNIARHAGCSLRNFFLQTQNSCHTLIVVESDSNDKKKTVGDGMPLFHSETHPSAAILRLAPVRNSCVPSLCFFLFFKQSCGKLTHSDWVLKLLKYKKLDKERIRIKQRIPVWKRNTSRNKNTDQNISPQAGKITLQEYHTNRSTKSFFLLRRKNIPVDYLRVL